jgi:hypothetical protein
MLRLWPLYVFAIEQSNSGTKAESVPVRNRILKV